MNVRDWLHVEDHCRGIWAILQKGRPGEAYNLGGGNERPNLEVAREILRLLGRPESLIRFVQDRPGHDRRYALDTTKAREESGWEPEVPFEEGLRRTVEWYQGNREWVARIKSGEYEKYYEQNYGRRLSSK